MPEPNQYSSGISVHRLSGMGLEFLSAIVVGGAIGYAIDRWWLASYPAGTVIGAVCGILVGGVVFIRKARIESRNALESYRREHPSTRAPDNPD